MSETHKIERRSKQWVDLIDTNPAGWFACGRILGLKSNRLSQLPPTFTRLCSLVELFLTDNQLATLPEGE